tara:strand:+ start:5801 stop:6133 length:333 start_codon:yes stop_codon:yes gene_type:complete
MEYAILRRYDETIELDWELERRRTTARKFKSMRRRYALTQEELALAADVHKNTISNAERYGRISPEEFYRYQQIAKQAHKDKSEGVLLNKIILSDISFADFKEFLATFLD